jgi:hypothetical protein
MELMRNWTCGRVINRDTWWRPSSSGSTREGQATAQHVVSLEPQRRARPRSRRIIWMSNGIVRRSERQSTTHRRRPVRQAAHPYHGLGTVVLTIVDAGWL